VGALVRRAAESGKRLAELTLEELKAGHPAFADDVYRALDLEAAVERRSVIGGPARAAVAAEIEALKRRLAERGIDVERTAREHGVADGDRG
jgi:argininosuccinate lyase